MGCRSRRYRRSVHCSRNCEHQKQREETIDTELTGKLWREFYTKRGKSWLVVRTGSMAPLIRPRDLVLMLPVAVEEVCCGDIIVFRRNGSLIGHRVLKKLSAGKDVCFIEKGDSAEFWGVFRPDDVIGRVAMVKSNSNMFSLSSPPSRFTSRILSVWFYWTSAAITRLRSSPYRSVKRLGKVLARLSLLSSKIMVRICCVIWYLSGLGLKAGAGLGGES